MARILIVDDSKTSRKFLRNMLEQAGHEIVAEAVDGAEGVEKFKIYRPDITTMDITMPEMSGLEAVKGIKKIDSNAKILMVSAMGQESLVREAIINGAKGFIVKPFKEEYLIKAIDTM